MAKSQSIFGQEVRDSIPRDYILIPRELYTRMVETTARYDIMDSQIPVEWDMSFLDVFNKGVDAVKEEMDRKAAIAEVAKRYEEEKKRMREEEREAKKHRCPDPGKLKSLMGAGWTVDQIGEELGGEKAEVYEWMSQLLRGEYDAALGGMEVR